MSSQKLVRAQSREGASVLPAAMSFHELYQQLRDGIADTAAARIKVRNLLAEMGDYYKEKKVVTGADTTLYFPVQGYGIQMIGGKNGSDYVPGKYNFYNTHGNRSHPAHDIFVLDKNQDAIDDNREQPIKIYSVTPGIVVSVEHCWDTTMNTRGGNYIYIYEPNSRMMYYYAHNTVLFVDIGQVVEAGQTIAYMGRTGLNAYKKRSPTHLHFSMLQFTENGSAYPVKGYKYLRRAKVKSD
jgi:murein DD-endopeptidase MepM/ murein hydrolase activator NlpD